MALVKPYIAAKAAPTEANFTLAVGDSMALVKPYIAAKAAPTEANSHRSQLNPALWERLQSRLPQPCTKPKGTPTEANLTLPVGATLVAMLHPRCHNNRG